MKKEVVNKISDSKSNDFGVASVILGILGIVFASVPGLILAVTALIFALKQNNRMRTKWSKAGLILAIIGIIFSIAVVVFNVWLLQNSDYLAQILQQTQ